MKKATISKGDEVVAIASQSFNEIEIYGIGELVSDSYPYKVKIDDKIITCNTICKLENWCELVDETDPEVRRIASSLSKT